MSSHNSHYYKERYNDLKEDLSRKRRELEEVQERFRKCESEAKKAKVESQEILKLYHGLQRELQLAYERNAKLQVDKVSYEGLLDSERKEFETYKSKQSVTSDENKKLKDALCAMRTEKLELETKFNAIVMENKDLRDRARQYEPRLREMDEIKRKQIQLEQFLNDQLQPEIKAQDERIQGAQINQDQIERYAKWNDLLKKECEEKSARLKRYDELVSYAAQLEDENGKLKSESQQLKEQLNLRRNAMELLRNTFNLSLSNAEELHDGLATLRQIIRNETTLIGQDLSVAMDRLKEIGASSSTAKEMDDTVMESSSDIHESVVEIGQSTSTQDDPCND